MNVVSTKYFQFIGTTWKNCGPSGAQEGALKSDQQFQEMLTADYGKVFGENQQLFNNLTSNLGQIIAKGPSQEGYSPQELAAMNSQAINAAAAGNEKIQTAIGENAATRGISGSPGVESGIEQAEKAQAATAVDTNLANTEANITQANYNTGRQNYWAATGAQEAAPGAFESPATSLAGQVSGANQNVGNQANENQQFSVGNQLLGLTEGLAGDAATAYAGYAKGH